MTAVPTQSAFTVYVSIVSTFQDLIMAPAAHSQVTPFYCLQQLVYHTNTQCPQAKTILPAQHQSGTGGKVGCLGCRHLNRKSPRKSRRIQRLSQLV
jgi:hypothetical protein